MSTPPSSAASSPLPSTSAANNSARLLDGLRWLSDTPPPKRHVAADDTLTADAAFRLAAEGTAMVWQGDFQNARQLLQALARRLDKRAPNYSRGDTAPGLADDFHRYRMAQAQRARTLGRLLIPLQAGWQIPLRRAPDVAAACTHALGALDAPAVLPLTELQGMIGAWEWAQRGVDVPALGATIHAHYGVFAPVRGEYVDLIAKAPLPAPCATALDLGTGTGVLAAVLARRGVGQVLACDASPRAVACARDNIARLKLGASITVVAADGFPAQVGLFDLIVCNPPWLPGKAGSLLEQAVYDPDSRLLRTLLADAGAHLTAHGELWLVLSDLAERLGLRTRDTLTGWMHAGGWRVIERHDTRPTHPRSRDASDPLHAARAGEITSLWRLGRA